MIMIIRQYTIGYNIVIEVIQFTKQIKASSISPFFANIGRNRVNTSYIIRSNNNG